MKDKGWKLLVRLFKEAKRNGEIDFDEQRILHTTDFNVTELLHFVQEAWEDSILSETEKQQITFLIKKIRDDAVTLANYDDIITDQEEALLMIIRDIFEEFLRRRNF